MSATIPYRSTVRFQLSSFEAQITFVSIKPKKELEKGKEKARRESTTNLPKLLASILSARTLQNLGATWVLIYKFCHIIDTAIDDDVQPVLDFVVRRNFFGGE